MSNLPLLHLPAAVEPLYGIWTRTTSAGTRARLQHVLQPVAHGSGPIAFLIELLSDTPAAREEAGWFLYTPSCTVLGFDVRGHPQSAHMSLDEFNGRMTHHILDAW